MGSSTISSTVRGPEREHAWRQTAWFDVEEKVQDDMTEMGYRGDFRVVGGGRNRCRLRMGKSYDRTGSQELPHT